MIFITGPLYAGKEEYIRQALGWGAEDFAANAVRDVQKLVPCDDLEKLADELTGRKVVIATEVGCGVVPADPLERRWREEAGRLSCLLAERADTVIRVCCGIPQLLKGEWP